jgi:Protein of unknown function (DUF2568)
MSERRPLPRSRLQAADALLLSLRVLMEAAIVGALAYWGARTGHSAGAKIALGIAAPVVGFGLWGAVDFRRAGRLAEPLRLAQELVISGVAAIASYAAGAHALGIALAALSVVYHALVYLAGRTLLKPLPRTASSDVGMQRGSLEAR